MIAQFRHSGIITTVSSLRAIFSLGTPFEAYLWKICSRKYKDKP